MTNNNSTLLNDVIKQKLTLINLALAGLREQSTHSEINPGDIELIEGLVSDDLLPICPTN